MRAAHLLEPVADSLCACVIPHYHFVVRLASVPGESVYHHANIAAGKSVYMALTQLRLE
jgi:hypothetical protein